MCVCLRDIEDDEEDDDKNLVIIQILELYKYKTETDSIKEMIKSGRVSARTILIDIYI